MRHKDLSIALAAAEKEKKYNVVLWLTITCRDAATLLVIRSL